MRRMEESLEQKYIQLQNAMQSKIVLYNKIELKTIKSVAGVDLAYWKQSNIEYAICCIVVLDYHSHEVIERKEYMAPVEVPYVPGCLAFRELPLFMGANSLLVNQPDVYFFDGNGYLHPRHMGLATHAGILLGKPTIGIAKSYYKIQDVDYCMPEDKEFAFTDIVIGGEVYGRVLRTHKGVKPIFLSIGNMVELDSAMQLTVSMVTKDSHIPMPTRLADIMTHECRKKYMEGSIGNYTECDKKSVE